MAMGSCASYSSDLTERPALRGLRLLAGRRVPGVARLPMNPTTAPSSG